MGIDYFGSCSGSFSLRGKLRDRRWEGGTLWSAGSHECVVRGWWMKRRKLRIKEWLGWKSWTRRCNRARARVRARLGRSLPVVDASNSSFIADFFFTQIKTRGR